jgi:hypothetical protein
MDGQDIRTLCHYIQDGDAMQLSSALAFGARGLVCRRLGGMEWNGLDCTYITSYTQPSMSRC